VRHGEIRRCRGEGRGAVLEAVRARSLRARWAARRLRTQVLLLLGTALLLVGTVTSGSSRDRPVADAPAQATMAPSKLPASTGTAAATTPASSAPEFITGLTAADVKLNLERRGFHCDGPVALATLQSWTCKSSQGTDIEFVVEVQGKDSTRIRSVDATVLQYNAQPSDAIAAEFLGFIATLPYENAEPARARDWVRSNIAKSGSELTIASARFELTRANTGRAHILDMIAVGAR